MHADDIQRKIESVVEIETTISGRGIRPKDIEDMIIPGTKACGFGRRSRPWLLDRWLVSIALRVECNLLSGTWDEPLG